MRLMRSNAMPTICQPEISPSLLAETIKLETRYVLKPMVDRLRLTWVPQVFIHYGNIANSRLLRIYGFVLPDNPNDNYELILQTSSMAPLYEQKQRLWKL